MSDARLAHLSKVIADEAERIAAECQRRERLAAGLAAADNADIPMDPSEQPTGLKLELIDAAGKFSQDEQPIELSDDEILKDVKLENDSETNALAEANVEAEHEGRPRAKGSAKGQGFGNSKGEGRTSDGVVKTILKSDK